MIRTTTWQPDTCGCIIQYTWDDAVPDAERTHTMSTIVPCEVHPAAGADTGKVLELQSVAPHENSRRKNRAIGLFLEQAEIGDLTQDGSYTFKPGVSVSWAWSGVDDARVITFTVTGVNLNNPRKNQIRAVLDSIFGPGKALLA